MCTLCLQGKDLVDMQALDQEAEKLVVGIKEKATAAEGDLNALIAAYPLKCKALLEGSSPEMEALRTR